MKRLFTILLLLLSVASVITWLSLPSNQSSVPIIYWVTDPSPARIQQVDLFHTWLKDEGHVNGQGQPLCEMRLDTVNRWPHKQVIQGISGVAGDLHDTFSSDGLQLLHALGMMVDITDIAIEHGFDPSKTFPAIESEISMAGRQFMFPCNLGCQQYWVNEAILERFDLPPLPRRWSIEDFEKRGKSFVEAANHGVRPRKYFFAAEVSRTVLIRSLGLSRFNETMTRCTLDDSRYVKVLKKIHQWTYQDHILPSAADRASLNTEEGFGWPGAQLFIKGHYALLLSSRYMCIRFRAFQKWRQKRKMGALKLAVIEHANGGFPNTMAATRSCGLYANGANPELARLFLQFLASPEYNMQIVKDGDDLPPNPKYTEIEEFARPKDWPNEWGCHEQFARAMKELAIGSSTSPFILSSTAGRLEGNAFAAFMNDRISAEQAAKRAQARINDEIQSFTNNNPSRKKEHKRLLELQKKIDLARLEGRKIPRKWLLNPFHKRYYQAMNWLEEE